ncbi:MAG: hypothetical protein JWN66_1924 [Sphingomonas bacterium]|uniref:hypothetical protein n=1 Tax=Sphingomonas bacterium TaxID=1895847 RepID=UPI00261132C2|nr:hypothetical protein [Sphingomonas bacterium]MDB5704808.1 hypothetical protein [Sphingomonas bacterium]
MKILALMAAGLIGAAALTPVAASASGTGQAVVVHERTVVRHHNRHDRWRWKTVCRTQWRNHHRTRVCTKVRSRW